MPGGMVWAFFLFVATVGGLILAAFVFILVGVACGSLPGLGWGSVTLECPHCGRQTPSQLPECKHCRRSFREEVAGIRPQPLPPKLRQ